MTSFIPPYKAFQEAIDSGNIDKIKHFLNQPNFDRLLKKYVLNTHMQPLSYTVKKNDPEIFDIIMEHNQDSTLQNCHHNFIAAHANNRTAKRNRFYFLVNILKNRDMDHALQIIFSNQVNECDVIEAAILTKDISVIKELLNFNFPISAQALDKLNSMPKTKNRDDIFNLLQDYCQQYCSDIIDNNLIYLTNDKKNIDSWQSIAMHSRVENFKDKERAVNAIEELSLIANNDNDLEILSSLFINGLNAAEGRLVNIFSDAENIIRLTLKNEKIYILAESHGITNFCAMPSNSDQFLTNLNDVFIQSACKFMGKQYSKSNFKINAYTYLNANKHKLKMYNIKDNQPILNKLKQAGQSR